MRSTEFIREAGPGGPGRIPTDAEWAARNAQGEKNAQNLKNWWNGAPQTGGTAVPTAQDPATVRGQGAATVAAPTVPVEPAPAEPAPSFNVPGAAQAGQGGYNYTTGVEQDRPHRPDAGADETTRNDYPFMPAPAVTPAPKPYVKNIKPRPKPIQAPTPAPATPDYTDPMGTDDASSIMAASRAGQAERAAAATTNVPKVYPVRPGDTLSKIAAANGTTVQAIMAANPSIKDPNKIAVGQKITISGAAAKPAAAKPAAPSNFDFDTSAPIIESTRHSELTNFEESVDRMRRLSTMLKG